MQLLKELKQIIFTLDQENIPYALCGGLAMAVYAMPRATLDIDLMIELDFLFRTKKAMQDLGYRLTAEPMEFQNGKIQIFRLFRKDTDSEDEFILDLLIVTPETKAAWNNKQKVEWEGGTISVISPEGLISLKRLRGSGKDKDDIAYLKGISDED